MQNYEILKRKVRSGSLILYFVFSLPRTNSTAFHIALTQASEVNGQLHEPFLNFNLKPIHYDTLLGEQDRSFDFGCGIILQRLNEFTSVQSPIKLIIHEQICNVTAEEFSLLLELSNNIIFLTRHPILQGFSYLTRFLNIYLNSSSSNGMKSEQISKLVSSMETSSNEDFSLLVNKFISKQQVLNILRKDPSHELTFEEILKAYYSAVDLAKRRLETVWSTFDYYLPKFLELKDKKNLVVLDSGDVLEHPKEIFQSITCKLSGLSFSCDMVNNWTKAIGKNFYTIENFSKDHPGMNRANSERSGWIGLAITSTGFVNQSQSFLPTIDDFPSNLKPLMSRLVLNYKMKMANVRRELSF